MLSVQTVLDQLMVRIDVIQDCICIGLVTGCEYYHLEVLVSFFKTLHHIRTDVYAGLKCSSMKVTYVNCFFIGEVNFENYVWVLSLDVVYTMDQCFIHIKYQHFLHYKHQK